jgi:glutamate-1-semialdehyde 2,1-aminomutase
MKTRLMDGGTQPMHFTQSLSLYARARESLAGGVSSHFRAAGKPCPMFFERAERSRIWDADGNEYIDYALGQGPMILGHSPPEVLDAVEAAMRRGQLFAGQHALEMNVAEKLQQMVPCAELVRFGNSGSEAVHTALRLARAHTGKERFIKFEGQYHGWLDNVMVSVNPSLDQAGDAESPNSVPWSQGQAQGAVAEAIVLPWNDLALLEKTIAGRHHEIAAVITEPMMCNTNCIVPTDGYLVALRELCTRRHIVLIFDEIITGFRVAPGGAQEYFGVTPDLAVLGKAMANGFPISAMVGKREFMRLIESGAVIHAGTYNTNLMVMAASDATMTRLAADNGSVYQRLFALGRRLMDGIGAAAERTGQEILLQGPGVMFWMGFTKEKSIRNYREHVVKTDAAKYARFCELMQERGVRLIGRGMWYVSAAHTEDDVDATVQASEEVFQSLRE